ncbi:MAG TPA: hypothetical protein VJ785_10345 [Anaerolineales bacterium]|nr:hypothetical protein [Anaerolineales bacterium]
MKVLRVFFLGLIFGWFMRWIMDVIFLEEDLRILKNENALLTQQLKTLESPKSLESKSVQKTGAPPSAEQAAPAPARKPRQSSARRDDLKLIKGVGPRIEKKLNDAGVYTFDQMSQLTTADLQAILGLSKHVEQKANNLVSQAKKLAKQAPRG